VPESLKDKKLSLDMGAPILVKHRGEFEDG
jgi:hypothetical protein